MSDYRFHTVFLSGRNAIRGGHSKLYLKGVTEDF